MAACAHGNGAPDAAAALAVACWLGAGFAWAHHSYAMFDMSQLRIARGTVAKVEWGSSHVFVWPYVQRSGQPGHYDLYAFEMSSPGYSERLGWTKHSAKPGDKITVQYFPLKDGRTGGELVTAVLADGSRTLPDRYLPELAKLLDEKRSPTGQSPPSPSQSPASRGQSPTSNPGAPR